MIPTIIHKVITKYEYNRTSTWLNTRFRLDTQLRDSYFGFDWYRKSFNLRFQHFPVPISTKIQTLNFVFISILYSLSDSTISTCYVVVVVVVVVVVSYAATTHCHIYYGCWNWKQLSSRKCIALVQKCRCTHKHALLWPPILVSSVQILSVLSISKITSFHHSNATKITTNIEKI